jgi:hypothetical protein
LIWIPLASFAQTGITTFSPGLTLVKKADKPVERLVSDRSIVDRLVEIDSKYRHTIPSDPADVVDSYIVKVEESVILDELKSIVSFTSVYRFDPLSLVDLLTVAKSSFMSNSVFTVVAISWLLFY